MTEHAGAIVTNLTPSPFQYADVVITGLRGSLRGPSASLIFCRRHQMVRSTDARQDTSLLDLTKAINQSVFPGHQGGPHNHSIFAMAVALRQAGTKEFKAYQASALDNARALTDEMRRLRYESGSGSVPGHRVVVRLGPRGRAGAVQEILSEMGVLAGFDLLQHELHASTLHMTSKGWSTDDFQWLAGVLHAAIGLGGHLDEGTSWKSVINSGGGEADSADGIGTTVSVERSLYQMRKIRLQVKDRVSRL